MTSRDRSDRQDARPTYVFSLIAFEAWNSNFPVGMYPDNETAGTSPSGRGPRRRGKGRHFRPTRRPRPSGGTQSSAEQQTTSDDVEKSADEPVMATTAREDVEFETAEPIETRKSFDRPERAPKAAENVASGPAISRAIDHVQEVITDLKSALEEMELALELLEEAERQKLDDEREIKALQKALERVNRFRGAPRSGERSSERSQE